MPKRTDIESVMIIGAGPIIIGQACEFDYSGTQAVKALKEEGYRVILVNSNPATIMTDPSMADATYIEPITPEMVAKIVEKERPDALLPTMGGQTGLNTALSLAKMGVLDACGTELIGASREAIDKAEDRELFRNAMAKIGLESAKSVLAHTPADAQGALEVIGLPAIIRPSFTMGGTGGGIAYNREQFEDIVRRGLEASPTTEVLIEESVVGWKEYEMEVVRDHADNCIIICSIENIDPMGVHTGDSVTVAPALTLTDKEYQIIRNASLAVLREIGVDTGGSNVQFAINPADGRMIVIEMNPRVSRSSALASKATGFPIAKVAAKLAVGYTLDEIQNDITKVTPASFEPSIDYVVTKMPRFTFEKFPGTDPYLTTSMKSVGEAMSIGRTFAESLQKALRSMETGLTGLDPIKFDDTSQDGITARLSLPAPDRILVIAQAMRHGFSDEDIHAINHYDPWYLEQIRMIVDAEDKVRETGLPDERVDLLNLKKMGFSDLRLAKLAGVNESTVRALRHTLEVTPVFKRIDTCAAEFPSSTSYMYGCYEGDGVNEPEDESDVSDKRKVMILGGGPNRIGQGIEFDYCCVHACFGLQEAGVETIMVNCNPETVSTDYDTSDRLYFESLTAEDVIAIARTEMSKGTLAGLIVQFGGQTPLKLARALEQEGIPIIGTSPDAIDRAEDRKRFQEMLHHLGLQQPKNGTCHNFKEACEVIARIGYPAVVRPSYVLGGRAMEIVHSDEGLESYFERSVEASEGNTILIDHFLQDAIEVDVDALCDGAQVFVAGIMEHIEEAGIHSGDSACSLPPYSLSQATITELRRQTEAMALELGVIGLMNVQFAVKDDDIYVLEVNPRASRTVPFVAKTIGIPIAKIAARIMAGETLASFKLSEPFYDHIAVKEAVFPFARFPNVDIILGPEMKSTGEVMGLDRDFGHAFAKAQLATGGVLPQEGCVFISVRDRDKGSAIEIGHRLVELGFTLIGTRGTARDLRAAGLEIETINKVLEGSPHIVDALKDGRIELVINTTEGAKAIADSFSLRRTALVKKVQYVTTMAGARAFVEAISAMRDGGLDVAPLQSYALAAT
ncbi:MAG: carbamoyl-phosphate synthase large subunit [Rhodospirillaceae bacterium]|jgi:carbamoyl-phosphate synthase large subunit|nr:carbamoyl-phosphate synthase large subunit [Rhodospirillaceae bacterium]